jgi:hypothetical protein
MLFGLIPGFGLGLGLLRRSITLTLCGAAFWAGVKIASSGQVDACLDAGGRVDPRGFCEIEKGAP